MKKIYIFINITAIVILLISCATVSQKKFVQPPYLISYTLNEDIRDTFDWFSARPDHIKEFFGQGRYVYSRSGSVDQGIYSKNFGQFDHIRLVEFKNDYLRIPRYTKTKNKIYIELMTVGDSQSYILSISRKGIPENIYISNQFIDYFDISPDDSEMAFQKLESANFNHIYRYLFKTGQLIRFTDETTGGLMPSYSPDGNWIAYCAYRKLRIRNIRTGIEKILVQDNLMKELPRWSPDGNWIIYQASPGGDESYDIYKVHISTGKIYRLTDNPGLDANPSFDKKGRHIIYISAPEKITRNQMIWMMDYKGNHKRPDLTSDTTVFYPLY